MKSKGLSGVVAAIIVVVVVGIGASAYYIGAVLPGGQTTSSAILTASQSSVTSSTLVSTASTSSMTSSSSQTSALASSGQGAQLKITASPVSHSLSGSQLTATCGLTKPAQGASYLQVTNTGTAPSTISNISFNYVDMGTESGKPTGTCSVAAGATAYITFTGIGNDMATAGEMFNVSITGDNGGFANVEGAFV
jgi:hypothetical protein